MMDVISVIATFAPEVAQVLKEHQAKRPEDVEVLLLAQLVKANADQIKILQGINNEVRKVLETERENGTKLENLLSRNGADA